MHRDVKSGRRYWPQSSITKKRLVQAVVSSPVVDCNSLGLGYFQLLEAKTVNNVPLFKFKDDLRNVSSQTAHFCRPIETLAPLWNLLLTHCINLVLSVLFILLICSSLAYCSLNCCCMSLIFFLGFVYEIFSIHKM